MGWRQDFLKILPSSPTPHSKPTVWDGDPYRPDQLLYQLPVLNPPCGMVTSFGLLGLCPGQGSEPTGWDGDLNSCDLTISASFPVQSPPCGMETYFSPLKGLYGRQSSKPTVWDGDRSLARLQPLDGGDLSPPCGMATRKTPLCSRI